MRSKLGRPTRLTWLPWLLIMIAVLALPVLARPGATNASPLASPLHVRLSLSGYIMEKSAGQWRIDGNLIAVDAQTTIDESRYPADLYAYAGVMASFQDGQTVPHADKITVLRPAGAGATLVQFAGPMKGVTGIEEWSVAGQVVKVSPQVYPAPPPVGALVGIIAEDRKGILYAIRVEVVAGDPNSVPVEFEGQVTSISPETQTWTIDHELTVSHNRHTSYPNGTPEVGNTLEVRARLAADGKLTAEIANVKAQGTPAVLYGFVTDLATEPGGAQSWTMQVLAQGQADPTPARLAIDQDTWIDRRNAQPGVGRWAEVRAAKLADGSFHAEVVRLRQPHMIQISGVLDGPTDWSFPTPITEHLVQASGPALAYTADGAAHAVWETGGQLLYSSRPPDSAWSTPSRVAAGIMPALMAGGDGTLHLVFSHQFMGNDEIYYVTQPPGGRWTLPVNVSHTSGKSYMPSLVVTPEHQLYAAWMDDSPGDWVVYSGALDSEFWSSLPVPNARGEIPVMAGGRDGALYLAWSSQVNPADVADVDVFLSEQRGGTWTIPANISDTPGVESVNVTLTAASDSMAHLAWLERHSLLTGQWTDIYYGYGRGIAWSAPNFVAVASDTIQEPHLTTDRDAMLLLTWVQGQTIQTSFGPLRLGMWQGSDPIAVPAGADLRDVAVARMPHGGVGATWVQVNATGAGEVSVYESSHASVLKARVWLPLLINP